MHSPRPLPRRRRLATLLAAVATLGALGGMGAVGACTSGTATQTPTQGQWRLTLVLEGVGRVTSTQNTSADIFEDGSISGAGGPLVCSTADTETSSTCAGTFALGEGPITLTATTSFAGWVFRSWTSGGTTISTDPTLVIDVTGIASGTDKTITATFVPADGGIDMDSSPAPGPSNDASNDGPTSNLDSSSPDSSEGAPVITAINCTLPSATCASGSATPETSMDFTGTHLQNPQGVVGAITVTWGPYAGGSVSIPDPSTIRTAVPSVAQPGTYGVTVTNSYGTSAPFSFTVHN